VEPAAFVVLASCAYCVFEPGDQIGECGAEVCEAGGVGQVPDFVDSPSQVLDAGLADGGRGG
jgi:hypothetical protein